MTPLRHARDTDGLARHRLDEGGVDLPEVPAALRDVGNDRLVILALSRDSHRAQSMVPRARAALETAGSPA